VEASAKADDSDLAIFRQKAFDKFHNTVVLRPSMTLNHYTGQARLRRQALCASRAIPSATADVCQNVGHHPFESFTGRICRSGSSNRFPSRKGMSGMSLLARFSRIYPEIWPDFSGFVRVFRFVFQVDSGFFGGFSEPIPVLAAPGVCVWTGPGLSFCVKAVTCK
jgi:hypothetical protein